MHFDYGYRGSFEISTTNDAAEFLNREIESWKSRESILADSDFKEAMNLLENLSLHVRGISFDEISTEIDHTFRHWKILFTHDSQMDHGIAVAEKSENPVAYTMGFIDALRETEIRIEFASPAYLSGYIRADRIMESNKTAIYSKNLENLLAENNEALHQLREMQNDVSADRERLQTEIRRIEDFADVRNAAVHATESVEAKLAMISSQAEEIQRRADETQKTVAEKFADIQAQATAVLSDRIFGESRTFWSNRATSAMRTAIGFNIAFYAMIAVLIVWVLFVWNELDAHLQAGMDYRALAIRAGLSATILGLGVWALRQILKTARAHQHLQIDARERVTMIETYIAMQRNMPTGTPVEHLLAGVFRPSSTGLVNEEPEPVFVWDALLKQLTQSPKVPPGP